MNDIRKLIESVEKIEESYFSRLAAELDDIIYSNPNVESEKLIRLVRDKYGDDAAQYVSDQLEVGLEEGESEIKYLKYPEGYEPPKMPERHKLDTMDWMHVPDDVIQMMKSLEHKMKSQNVWDKGVALAGDEDKLWKHIQWRAEEIQDDYRGSGEGIGTSDMNHFVRSIFRDIGEDDIWGWDKKLASDEDMERDKANRGAKFGKAIRGEGIEEGEEDKNLGPYEDNYEQWLGQTVKITGGEHQGETGKVIDANWERNDTGSREGVYQVKLYNGPVVTLYLGEWTHDQIELAYDPTHRPDGKYDPSMEEGKIDEVVSEWMKRLDRL